MNQGKHEVFPYCRERWPGERAGVWSSGERVQVAVGRALTIGVRASAVRAWPIVSPSLRMLVSYFEREGGLV
jgi:hypothetical protein